MDAYFRRFLLQRDLDPTGISGTGVVAFGIRFPDGTCVVRWNPPPGKPAQTAVWDSVVDMIDIHGHGGSTTIRWLDSEE